MESNPLTLNQNDISLILNIMYQVRNDRRALWNITSDQFEALRKKLRVIDLQIFVRTVDTKGVTNA